MSTSVSRMARHLLAKLLRSFRMVDFRSKLLIKPITPLEETKIVVRIPKEISSLRLVSIRSIMALCAEYRFSFGDNSLIESIMVCCTVVSGKKGTKENKKIREAGIASKKLKEIPAALSFSFKSRILLAMTEPTS